MAQRHKDCDQQHQHKGDEQTAEGVVEDEHEAPDGLKTVYKLGVARQVGALIDGAVELRGGEGAVAGDMEHSPGAAQGVDAGVCDDGGLLVVVGLGNQKALHADHGAAHDGVLIKPGHRVGGRCPPARAMEKSMLSPSSTPNMEIMEGDA